MKERIFKSFAALGVMATLVLSTASPAFAQEVSGAEIHQSQALNLKIEESMPSVGNEALIRFNTGWIQNNLLNNQMTQFTSPIVSSPGTTIGYGEIDMVGPYMQGTVTLQGTDGSKDSMDFSNLSGNMVRFSWTAQAGVNYVFFYRVSPISPFNNNAAVFHRYYS